MSQPIKCPKCSTYMKKCKKCGVVYCANCQKAMGKTALKCPDCGSIAYENAIK